MSTEKPNRVLLVDDDPMQREFLQDVLEKQAFEIHHAENGETALKQVDNVQPDCILLDVCMPGTDGYDVCRRLKNDETTQMIPVVMVTALNESQDRIQGIECGADEFLSKPVDQTELKSRVASLLKVKAYYDHMRRDREELEQEVQKRTAEYKEAIQRANEATLDTIYRMSRIAEHKDPETGEHVQRMGSYCSALGQQLNLDEQTLELLCYAPALHDVGKVGVPDKILMKPEKLAPEEWNVMQKHTTIGSEALGGSSSEVIKMAEVIARSHHEKWDGTGYPDSLSGEDIPLVARITKIADVFDSLTSRRPFREPYSTDDALDFIGSRSESHFDPTVVEAFFVIQDQIMDIKQQWPDVQNLSEPLVDWTTDEE